MRIFRMRDNRGATAVEYGLIVALIFLAILVGVVAVATARRHVEQRSDRSS